MHATHIFNICVFVDYIICCSPDLQGTAEHARGVGCCGDLDRQGQDSIEREASGHA